MEYIGLLGLIGLIGYFSAKSLKSKFDLLKKTLPDTESRIARNEKFISDLQAEIEHLNSILQNYATRSDLNGVSSNLRQIQSDLQRLEKNFNAELKNYATVSSLKNIENKLFDLPQSSDLQNVKDALQDIKRSVVALEDRINAIETSKMPPIGTSTSTSDSDVKILVQRISSLETDNRNLHQKISDQNALLAQNKNDFAQIQYAFNNLQNNFGVQISRLSEQLDQYKKFNDALEERVKKLEGSGGGNPPVTSAPLTIKDFQIRKNNRQFFTNEIRDAEKSLATAEKVSDIIFFLKNSNFAKKESFIQVIENYRRNLQKFADKLKRGKFDEDNFSEEASKAFFSTLSKYFLTTIPVSIYRGNKEDPAFYRAFLEKINEYLAACHVYTEFVEPKKFMTHDNLEKMNVIKKSTDVKSEDKRIYEVERLPYFLEYLTEDGDIEHVVFEGTMTVMKFEGVTK